MSFYDAAPSLSHLYVQGPPCLRLSEWRLDELAVLAPPPSPALSECEKPYRSRKSRTAPHVRVQIKSDIMALFKPKNTRRSEIEMVPSIQLEEMQTLEAGTVSPLALEVSSPIEGETAQWPPIRTPKPVTPLPPHIDPYPAPIVFSLVGEPPGRGLPLLLLYLDPVRALQRLHLPVEDIFAPFGFSKVHIFCMWPGNSKIYTERQLEAYNESGGPVVRLQVVFLILQAYAHLFEEISPMPRLPSDMMSLDRLWLVALQHVEENKFTAEVHWR
ncbi:uncharacterized protein C8Q71DRAFT_727104 [Rhodofomes roseus]|uniref:Uncharacterized protein n=1 Tax=Rhodofomes roseus TaxID=34475 RepID=A0ABQ8K2F5_9APHY|nr:uncharacterized protein C8Q71DRAFT_727104 [Rhodofomes roseus]KAH9830905.1 hypothetical protein C8Q71DRAFT_727104 [Rhodofomes roseus]